MSRCLCLLALVALTGCHSGPLPQPEAAPNPTPAGASKDSSAPDNRPVIVAFGDSLTAGYGADTGNSYPDYLQQDLNESGYHYRVANLGISGNTTKDGVHRLKDVLALKPALVIVEFGGNDGLRGIPIAESRANLDQIVATLVQSGTEVVLGGITLPPNYGPDYIAEFNQTYATLARKYRTPLLPFLLKDVYGTPGGMQEDGIHATAKGNQQVARNLLPLVTPLIEK